MKISTRGIQSVKKIPTGFTAHYSGVYLGTFGSGAMATAATVGAKFYEEHLRTSKEERKLAREHAKQYPDQTAPAKLEKGIYRRGSRFIVSSPRYLGYFNTYAAALEARNAVPRKYKTVEQDSASFEDRKLILD